MKSTLQVRYKDISWQELCEIHSSPPFMECTAEDIKRWETVKRGSLVTIEIPAFETGPQCGGPWYKVISDTHTGSVCPHIAEIGD